MQGGYHAAVNSISHALHLHAGMGNMREAAQLLLSILNRTFGETNGIFSGLYNVSPQSPEDGAGRYLFWGFELWDFQLAGILFCVMLNFVFGTRLVELILCYVLG